MKFSALPAIAGASLLLSFSTHAALIDQGGGLIYDNVLDVTWLSDANLAASNTFGVTGINAVGSMTWGKAEEFIAGMNADGGTGYLGVNTWRQSTVAPVNASTFDTTFTYDGSTDRSYQLSAPIDPTYNQSGQSQGFTGSELAYQYHNNFEAIGACSGVGTSATYGCVSSTVYGIDDAPDSQGNKALFSNIINGVYWAGTELDSSSAFYFATYSGSQQTIGKNVAYYVWAVAPGNVAANAVPVPGAVWLFGSALMGLAGLARRR